LILDLALVFVLSYLLGAVPSGYLLVRRLRGSDIRQEGSGNIGATNALRTAGWAAGLGTLIADMGKGALAVLLAPRLLGAGPSEPAGAVAVLGVVVGHAFPVTLRFHGGKGVACAVGGSLALFPRISLIALAAFLAAVALTRRVSVGSIVFAAVLPLAVLAVHGPWPEFPILLAACALVVARHSGNIARLLAGKEPKLGER